MHSVLTELLEILAEMVDPQEAEDYVNHVGMSFGRLLNDDYRAAFLASKLDARQVAASLVDLKARIDGGFSIESIDDEKIVLVNTACPFGDKVVGRPMLCRMTVNVFGQIAAENLGHVRVRLDEAIARGDPRCRVTVAVAKPDEPAGGGESEFFASSTQ